MILYCGGLIEENPLTEFRKARPTNGKLAGMLAQQINVRKMKKSAY
jgi:hypothetical protein